MRKVWFGTMYILAILGCFFLVFRLPAVWPVTVAGTIMAMMSSTATLLGGRHEGKSEM